MRNPTSDEKIQAQSIEEIRDALDRERRRLARVKNRLKFRRRVISGGTLLNAVVLHFLELPPSEREVIARKGLASYEMRLMSDEVTEIDLGTIGERSKAQPRRARKEPISPPASLTELPLRDGETNSKNEPTKRANMPKS